jgi:hypothetical protein
MEETPLKAKLARQVKYINENNSVIFYAKPSHVLQWVE